MALFLVRENDRLYIHTVKGVVMATVAYYRDGVPYDSGNRPIITFGPKDSNKGNSNFPPGIMPPYGGSFDPVDDRMKHKWEGSFSSEDEVTKEEQAAADAMRAAEKKAVLEDKAKTEVILSQNKKNEQISKDKLIKVNSSINNLKKSLATTKDKLDKFALQYKLNNLDFEQKQAEIDYILSVAQRFGTESHYYNVLAYDSYHPGGLTAAEIRSRLKTSQEKNKESKNFFSKASTLQNQLNSLKQQKKAKELDSTVKAVSDIITSYGEGVAKVFSNKLSNQAKELAANISGKKIRSYNEAMATFDKIRKNPKLNINAKDKEAISQALKALDVKSMSYNFNLMGKTFGLLDKGFKAETLIQKVKDGFSTGNWEPLLVEVEAIALSGVAASYSYGFITSILAGIGIAALSSPVALIIVVVLTAFMSSYIDADAARKFNDIIIPSAF
jgi:hypothetical protein